MVLQVVGEGGNLEEVGEVLLVLLVLLVAQERVEEEGVGLRER